MVRHDQIITDRFTRGIIRRKVRELIDGSGFREGDAEELEQRLFCMLLRSLSSFEESHPRHRNAFITTVVERSAAMIRRERRRRKRHFGAVRSLDSLPTGGNDGAAEVSLHVADPGARRTFAQVDLALDLAVILAELPEELRDLAHRLQRQTLTEIAREANLPLTTVQRRLRIVGCTATPFRLKSGTICTPDGFLNHVCYEVGVRELIVQGFLCPLVTKVGLNKPDVDNLHIRGGEYVAGEVEDLMDQDNLVEAACGEIVGYTATRNACLIFASGVHHGKHIVRVLREKHGVECGFVSGDTPTAERDAVLARFKSGGLKYLCNVNVLTTGFDAPHIDCVALVRPTLSPGLYYQMVGRGFRLHPSKTNCLVLDFGGNVLRHGPVDQIRVRERDGGSGPPPVKECPECHTVVMAGRAACPDCGYEFPPPERSKHDAKASNAGILSGQVTVETLAVYDVVHSVHTKRGAGDDAPKSLRVDYKVGWHRWKSEWVCLEHTGHARAKAVAWWRQRSKEPVPATAAEAVEIAKAGGLADTKSITVRSVSGEDYDRITDHQLGPIPEAVERAAPEEELFPFGYNVIPPADDDSYRAPTEEIPW
jgi:DNA repair protein RadD